MSMKGASQEKTFERKIRIELHGGIGNQLFQYYAGMYLAARKKGQLILDCSHLASSWESHVVKSNGSMKSPLQQLGLPGKYVLQNKFVFFFEKVHRYIRAKLGITTHLSVPKILRNHYNSNQIGFDEKLEEIDANSIAGYFQTWKYFDYVVEAKPTLRPFVSNPSNWFIEMMERAKVSRPIMIHVRQHYSYLAETFSPLKQNYYAHAINQVTKDLCGNPIWVFAQKNLELDILLPAEILSRCIIVEPPTESLDFESLLLMSMGSSIICANSTFSYWAALLSGDNCMVVAPKRVFVKDDNPVDYYKSTWILI